MLELTCVLCGVEYIIVMSVLKVYRTFVLPETFPAGFTCKTLLSSDFNPPHLCTCPKTRPGFPISYVMVFFYSVSVIVRFVDIGGIEDHLFIILLELPLIDQSINNESIIKPLVQLRLSADSASI